MRPSSEESEAMAAERNSETHPQRRRRVPRVVLGLAALLLLGSVVFLLGVGRWLVAEDPLEKAQAIVVLSGRMPMRAMEAARLYRQGYAPEVWLTHSTEPGLTLAAAGISYVGEDIYNVQVLTHEGVPAAAIHLL